MGPVGILTDFKNLYGCFGVPSGPIGLVAPLSFKLFDSRPQTSNVGPFSIEAHNFRPFQNSCHGFLTRYLSHFRPVGPEFRFSRFSVGTKKMRDEKLRRFVVVSSREVPSLAVSCPFKIFNVR